MGQRGCFVTKISDILYNLPNDSTIKMTLRYESSEDFLSKRK